MNQIVEFNEFESRMQEFRQRYDGVVYDLTIPAQEKQARSDRFTIGKVIAELDRRHKDVKAPLQEKVVVIDGERKRIKDELLTIQEKIKGQIEAHEAKIAAKVDAIRELAEFGEGVTPDAGHVAERLERARSINPEAGYEDCKDDAIGALYAVTRRLETLLAERTKAEAEQSELERLRKEAAERERADREERIRKEAAEKATRDAEEKSRAEIAASMMREEKERAAKLKAEHEAKRQAEAAEAARIKAELEAKLAAERAAKAERERMEREQRAAAAKVEAERKADDARKAKAAHRAKIHAEIKQSLLDNGMEKKTAEITLSLLVEGAIRHVAVTY